MMKKNQKAAFVKQASEELKRYSSIGVMRLSGKPDRMLQAARTRLRGEARILMGRKSLLQRILESDERSRPLVKELTGTSAIILSNTEPFELYRKFRSASIKLAAKPKQVAPEDINVPAGETGVAPGQAVTELKLAGIDVQIQKGKVVIAKDKVVAKKGTVISLQLAKALHTLNIAPFEAYLEPAVIYSSGLTFTKEVLHIDPARTTQKVMAGFRAALALSMELGLVNRYTVVPLLQKGYRNALFLGTEVNSYDTGVLEHVLAKAAAQAGALDAAAAKK